jgi:nitrogen fixation-related uncharacterized protein
MDKTTENEKMKKGTVRLRHSRRPIGNPEMTVDRKYDRNYEENTITFRVTEIDEKFGIIKLEENNRHVFCRHKTFHLNTKAMWDDFIEALQQYPCYRRMSVCGTDVFEKYIFKVPIKEEKTIAYRQEEFQEEHWIKYNGVHYDPSKIYVVEYHDGEECDEKEIRNNIKSIRPVCNQKLERPFASNVKIEFIGICECHYYSVLKKSLTEYKFSTDFTKTNEILMNSSNRKHYSSNIHVECMDDVSPGENVFDMKNLSNITHIGIIPPPIKTQKVRFGNAKDAHLIAASNLSKQSWISGFKVWYKINSSDNWTYCNEYKGNDNCFSMNLIDLSSEYNTNDGLQCRYIKVVVSSYNINPSFRLAVYGKHSPNEKTEEKKDLYVEYIIEFPANNTKNIPDGQINNRHSRYWGKKEYPNRTRCKMAFLQQLKNGEFDDEEGDCHNYETDDDDDNESVYSYATCDKCPEWKDPICHSDEESVRSDFSDDYDVITSTIEYPGALRQFMNARESPSASSLTRTKCDYVAATR